jgi:PAS domain S-box-containing protein
LLEHSRQVLDTLDRLRTITADLEAERRGYLQTLDPAYIKAYGISDARVRQDVQALQALVKNDPLQSLRADHLALTVSATLRETDDMVKTARMSGLAALAMIRNMDEIRSQFDQMVDNERFLLVDQEARADSLEQRKTWLIAAAIVMIAALAAAALAFARLEARHRRRTTDENVRLHRDLEERNRRIRRLFDSDIIGIMIWDLEGRILDANDAFLRMVGYDREDLAAGRLHRTDLTPPEWRDRDERTLAELKMLGSVPQFEKEYFRKDGSRLSVLIGAASFEDTENQGVAFVLDLTGRKQAEAEARENERRYREIQMELAHANRVATMGQLTASIAHEVNQPVTATIGNAQAALRWLAHEPPNLEETRQLLDRISKDGRRASDVVGRIRDLTRKAPPRKERLEVNEAILEVTALTRGEVVRNGVLVRTKLAEDLPLVQADRVQVQQVVLNLIMNAVEAMTGVDEGTRELLISTGKNASKSVLVSLQDSGPGLDPRSADRVFEAFYTTKSAGMGMGLAICRSIIEAHGGRMWVGANEPRGAVFQFTLPPEGDEIVTAEPARKAATLG